MVIVYNQMMGCDATFYWLAKNGATIQKPTTQLYDPLKIPKLKKKESKKKNGCKSKK